MTTSLIYWEEYVVGAACTIAPKEASTLYDAHLLPINWFEAIKYTYIGSLIVLELLLKGPGKGTKDSYVSCLECFLYIVIKI